MKYSTIIGLLFWMGCVQGPEPQPSPPKSQQTINEGGFRITRLSVTPFYKDTPEHPAEYWSQTFYLDTDGTAVYVNQRDAPILHIDRAGHYVRSIGRPGQGPEGIQGPILGTGASGSSLALIDRRHVILFQDGAVQTRFDYTNNGTFFGNGYTRCRGFAVADNQVVVPWSPSREPQHVATVFSTSGEILNTVVDEAVDTALTNHNPAANSTVWRYSNGVWYAASLFAPRIALFDKNFQKMGDLRFDSPDSLRYELNWFEEDRENITNPKRRVPLFFSFQVMGYEGLLMSQGMLHQIDLKTGTLKGLYRFDAPEHEGLTRFPFANFPYFALLDDRTLVLAHIMRDFAGELFAVKLPPLADAQL